MTSDASDLMAEALKQVTISGSFMPEDIGRKVGMNKPRAEAAARALANAGVLVLGFDCAAHFSSDFRKMRTTSAAKPAKKLSAKKKAVRV